MELIQSKINEDIKLHQYKNIEDVKQQRDNESKELEKLNEKVLASINTLQQQENPYEELGHITYKTFSSGAPEGDSVQVWQQGNEETNGGVKTVPRIFLLNELKEGTLSYDFKMHETVMNKIGLTYQDVISTVNEFNEPSENDKSISKIVALSNDRKEFFAKFNESGRKSDAATEEEKNEINQIQEQINKYNFYSNLMTYNQIHKNKSFFRSLSARYMAWVKSSEQITVRGLDEGNSAYKSSTFKNLEKEINLRTDKKTTSDHLKNFRNVIAHLNEYQLKSAPVQMNDKYTARKWSEMMEEFKEPYNCYQIKKRNEVSVVEKKLLKKINMEKNQISGAFTAVTHEKFGYALACQDEVQYYNELYNVCLDIASMKKEEGNV